MSEATRFRDKSGRTFSVVPLTKPVAGERAAEIVRIHNTIPFQNWSVSDLLADRDQSRVFHAKWELSRLALNEAGRPIAFNVAFERDPDGEYYFEPCIYLHRLAVEPELRGQFVGALLHVETIGRAFERGMKVLTPPAGGFSVFGQANETSESASLLAFYKDIGLHTVGRKSYGDRVDLILRLTRESFEASRHVALYARQLISV